MRAWLRTVYDKETHPILSVVSSHLATWDFDMHPNFRFSIFVHGELARPTMHLSSQALRRTLMIASDNNEARADFIYQRVEETGLCQLFMEDEQTGYVIEKILAS
jgi:hypothetical protein